MIIGVDARELSGSPTGTGRYLRSILRQWIQTGQDRIVAYFNGPPPPDDVLNAPHVTVRSLCSSRRRGLIWQQILLPRAASADNLDVLFSPAYFCPLRMRLPRVTTVHDLACYYAAHDFGLLEGVRRRVLISASIRVSSSVLAVSRFTRDEIVRRFPAVETRVVDIPLGADADMLPGPARDEARQELALHGPLVLAVGSVFNRRCAPELLLAFARVARSIPGATLDIVGDNRTSPRLDLAGLAASLGIAEHVRLSGFVDEVALATRLAAADLCVSLSDYEGFGLTALEAMARGVPVVAADRPSLSEICGRGAWLVDPRNVAEVASAILAVLSAPERREELIRRGHSHAARFSWSTTAARTRDALMAAIRQ